MTAIRSCRGITLLEMMIVILLIAVLVAIIVPSLTESKNSANEASAIGSMKAIIAGQAQFREADREVDGHLDYATL